MTPEEEFERALQRYEQACAEWKLAITCYVRDVGQVQAMPKLEEALDILPMAKAGDSHPHEWAFLFRRRLHSMNISMFSSYVASTGIYLSLSPRVGSQSCSSGNLVIVASLPTWFSLAVVERECTLVHYVSVFTRRNALLRNPQALFCYQGTRTSVAHCGVDVNMLSCEYGQTQKQTNDSSLRTARQRSHRAYQRLVWMLFRCGGYSVSPADGGTWRDTPVPSPKQGLTHIPIAEARGLTLEAHNRICRVDAVFLSPEEVKLRASRATPIVDEK